MKTVSFREYVVEVLKNAIYEKGEEMPVVNGHRSVTDVKAHKKKRICA